MIYSSDIINVIIFQVLQRQESPQNSLSYQDPKKMVTNKAACHELKDYQMIFLK